MSAAEPPLTNGALLKYRVQALEERLVGHEMAVKRVDDRLDDKDKRDQRLEDKMDALQKSHERMTNWLMATAASVLIAGFSAVMAVVLNT